MPQLTVHIDFKSPYAYLAIAYTRSLIAELDVEALWQPFVLDIPSYLGSAKLDKSGKVASQSRSAEQWSGVKYAYYDCRRYANLRGMTIRGTEKIWNSELAGLGMLWAREQGDETLQRYIDRVYEPFWRRDLDIEDIEVIKRVLISADADIEGFDDWRQQGMSALMALQEDSFDRGIFGVPTYEYEGELFFGREHLPRLYWLLSGQQGSAPDIANSLLPDDQVDKAGTKLLEIGIDPEDYASALAVPEIIAMQQSLDLDILWYQISAHRPVDNTEATDHSRSARHRRHRLHQHELDRQRYGVQANPDICADITWSQPTEAVNWAGGGRLGSPVFRLGEEVFCGRQHLPLICARLTPH